jgi:threonine dehydrogenase-like Zn-dependent dehydrogenase
MDEIIAASELPGFLRRAQAVLEKRDSEGNEIYKTGAGKRMRVMRRGDRVVLQPIAGCGSCTKKG